MVQHLWTLRQRLNKRSFNNIIFIDITSIKNKETRNECENKTNKENIVCAKNEQLPTLIPLSISYFLFLWKFSDGKRGKNCSGKMKLSM